MDKAGLQKEIAKLASVTDNAKKAAGYNQIVDTIYKSHNVEVAKELANHLLAEDSSFLYAKPVLQHMAKSFETLRNDERLELGNFLVGAIRPRVVSFEEEDALIREEISKVYEDQEDWGQAAQVLSGMNIESGNKTWSLKEKLEKYIKIAEFYLEDDNYVAAEMNMSKAAQSIHEIDDVYLELRTKVCTAKIYDGKKKFLQGASAFYNLSQQTSYGIPDQELKALLNRAIICAILASAGPQRSRILAMIYKDDRSRSLSNFDIFEKMYLDRLITKTESKKFSEGLKQHQVAVLDVIENYTVLDKAIIEHNIVAASKIYNNISFQELGKLLEITPQKAEEMIASMVSEQRIKATLDQLSGLVFFSDEEESLNTWDAQVTSVCRQIDDIITDISIRHPKKVEALVAKIN
mmetsp:Transcript_32751/g.37135  ORF Transcript_32751/g.37135 Transcript_32751/m.37135 type:complete len:407 (+) Transcript_32751:64-1284(+)